MIKSHNHTLGMLNAQYRSVLKKCWQLNLLAAGIALGLTSAALADGTQDDAQEEGSQVSYSDILKGINTHKKDTIISPNTIVVKGKDCRFREDPGKENFEKLMMANKANNNL